MYNLLLKSERPYTPLADSIGIHSCSFLHYYCEFVSDRYTKRQLVDAIRGGSHIAFRYLVTFAESMLRTHALWFVDCAMAAEDIVQDVYAKLGELTLVYLQ